MKYRVWHKVEKWWFHEKWAGQEDHLEQSLFVGPTGRVFWFSYKGITELTDQVEVFLYIGRDDKNGVEIYDGDRVKFKAVVMGEVTGVIKWYPVTSSWSINYGDNTTLYTMEFIEYVEVIGNIHQK